LKPEGFKLLFQKPQTKHTEKELETFHSLSPYQTLKRVKKGITNHCILFRFFKKKKDLYRDVTHVIQLRTGSKVFRNEELLFNPQLELSQRVIAVAYYSIPREGENKRKLEETERHVGLANCILRDEYNYMNLRSTSNHPLSINH